MGKRSGMIRARHERPISSACVRARGRCDLRRAAGNSAGSGSRAAGRIGVALQAARSGRSAGSGNPGSDESGGREFDFASARSGALLPMRRSSDRRTACDACQLAVCPLTLAPLPALASPASDGRCRGCTRRVRCPVPGTAVTARRGSRPECLAGRFIRRRGLVCARDHCAESGTHGRAGSARGAEPGDCECSAGFRTVSARRRIGPADRPVHGIQGRGTRHADPAGNCGPGLRHRRISVPARLSDAARARHGDAVTGIRRGAHRTRSTPGDVPPDPPNVSERPRPGKSTTQGGERRVIAESKQKFAPRNPHACWSVLRRRNEARESLRPGRHDSRRLVRRRAQVDN